MARMDSVGSKEYNPNPYTALIVSTLDQDRDYEFLALQRFLDRMYELLENKKSSLVALLRQLDEEPHNFKDLHFNISLGDDNFPNEIRLLYKDPHSETGAGRDSHVNMVGLTINLTVYPTYLSLVEMDNDDTVGLSGGSTKRSDLEIRESKTLDGIFKLCLSVMTSSAWKDLQDKESPLRQSPLLSDRYYSRFFEKLNPKGIDAITDKVDDFLRTLIKISDSEDLDFSGTRAAGDLKRKPRVYFGQDLGKVDPPNAESDLWFDLILDTFAERVDPLGKDMPQMAPEALTQMENLVRLKKRLAALASSQD